jgi:hypothetical protein
MWFQIIGPVRNAEAIAEADSLPALRRRLRKCAKINPTHVIGRDICLNAGQYEIDLCVGRRYRVLQPKPNDSTHLIRIVDGSGEDYLYPAAWFRVEH